MDQENVKESQRHFKYDRMWIRIRIWLISESVTFWHWQTMCIGFRELYQVNFKEKCKLQLISRKRGDTFRNCRDIRVFKNLDEFS